MYPSPFLSNTLQLLYLYLYRIAFIIDVSRLEMYLWDFYAYLMKNTGMKTAPNRITGMYIYTSS